MPISSRPSDDLPKDCMSHHIKKTSLNNIEDRRISAVDRLRGFRETRISSTSPDFSQMKLISVCVITDPRVSLSTEMQQTPRWRALSPGYGHCNFQEDGLSDRNKLITIGFRPCK
jgi:hypothetical protein